MIYQASTPLPTLRRKIRRAFFLLLAAYAVFGAIMIAFIFATSGLTPRVIHVNYDSIAASIQMRNSWEEIQNVEEYRRKPLQKLVEQFDKAIAFEVGNVTETNEGDITKSIRTLWELAKKSDFNIEAQDSIKMNNLLDLLVKVNEEGMFNIAEQSTRLSHKVLALSILFFVITLTLALFVSDGLAMRLSLPLKDMAEILKQDSSLDKKIKLPRPTSLEMRILSTELAHLWNRLSEFQKMNIEELAVQRKRLETILASVEDAILVLDNNGRILHCSDGMLKILGMTTDLVNEEPWSDLPVNNENYLKLRELLRPELVDENSVELDVDGKKRIYAGRYREIKIGANQNVGLVYLLHDITEVRLRERLKSEFIGVLSHELKTPLQSLGTAAELLSHRKESMDEDSKMLIDTINEDVSRIRSVANDFMQVGLADHHSLKLRLEKLPLSDLLKEWMKPFKVIARDKSVTLEFIKEGSDTIWANIDAVKLPWAISNLLANAIRVSKPDTKVTVYITDRSDKAKIEIRDEGPGIPEDVQKRMFEPYFQVPASDGGSSTGYLGLGLTIAKEVVEAHEGTIEYFPRRPHGSVFRLSLPFVIVYQS